MLDRLSVRRALDPLPPAEDRLHTDGKLSEAERLGQVVVGTDREPGHLVRLLGLRGQHQHRGPAVPLDPRADLETIHPRKHQVEDHEVGTGLGVSTKGLGTVGGDDDVISLAPETGPNSFGDRVLVLDDEHGLSSHDVIVSTPPRPQRLRGVEKSW